MNKNSICLLILAIMAGVMLVAALDGYRTRNEPSAQQVPLPDIAGDYWTTVIYDDSPESSRFLRFFESDLVLNGIKNRERHNELASDNPYYLENFKPRLKEANSFPIFLIQEPNGNSCLILSKDTIPNSPEELLGHIRRRCQPKEPVKKVAEVVKKIVPLVADTVKKATIPDDSLLWKGAAFLISLLGSGGVLVRNFTKN